MNSNTTASVLNKVTADLENTQYSTSQRGGLTVTVTDSYIYKTLNINRPIAASNYLLRKDVVG